MRDLIRGVATVLVLSLARVCAGDTNVVIQSFDGNGELRFSQTTNAVSYRVEWASSAGGPWTNTWLQIYNLIPTNQNDMVAHVPMFYRIVAVRSTNVVVAGDWSGPYVSTNGMGSGNLLLHMNEDSTLSGWNVGTSTGAFTGWYLVSSSNTWGTIGTQGATFTANVSKVTMTGRMYFFTMYADFTAKKDQ